MPKHQAMGQSSSQKVDTQEAPVPPDFNFRGEPPHWVRQLFLEPLVDGWKREIVIRSTPIKSKKADAYYYAPDGEKFRSRREIGQYLQEKGITKYSPIYNFWFNGKILGEEFAPYEVVRQSLPLAKKAQASPKPEPIYEVIESDDESNAPVLQESMPEEEMVFDEEIEIDSGQAAVFDPVALSSLRDLSVPIALPIVQETYERMIPVVREKRAPLNIPKKRKIPVEELTTSKCTKGPKTKRRYCICADVEHGQMVFCDNIKCEIGWYHFKCVDVQKCPPGSWYCPICRGSTSDVMNPAYYV